MQTDILTLSHTIINHGSALVPIRLTTAVRHMISRLNSDLAPQGGAFVCGAGAVEGQYIYI